MNQKPPLTRSEIRRELTWIRKTRAALEPFLAGEYTEETCNLIPKDLDAKLIRRYAELRRMHEAL